MRIELTEQQKESREAFRAFVEAEILPHADQYDQQERIPSEVIERLAAQGYLGAALPREAGGAGMDMITFGLLNEEIGRACSAIRGLLTAHTMVARALSRWGTRSQKARWLPELASGRVIAAFGLTEPQAGSDAANLETVAVQSGKDYVLRGHKKWITFGQVADLFLVFTRSREGPAAFLIEKNTPGVRTVPISGMLGMRAAMLADLHLTDCKISSDQLLGKIGFGISHVAGMALDDGRYSVAWGCVGLARACLEAGIKYANSRKQFGAYLAEHQLIQRMITGMAVSTEAARLLCYNAGYLKEIGDPSSVLQTSIAKYFASQSANRIAQDAVQIHGANGCSRDYPVQRYMRDAKIMEIIEGTHQFYEISIAREISRRFGALT
jgi:glutaryl-CoA dehydrogenase (non-decarboxylating)